MNWASIVHPSDDLIRDPDKRLIGWLLRLKTGSCWCPVGIGNPMYTSHSALCDEIRAFVSQVQ